MATIYTDEEIKSISNNPNVYYASRNRVSLSLEFKQKMYDEWIKTPCMTIIRKFLYENGFDSPYVNNVTCHTYHFGFKKYGRPKKYGCPNSSLEMFTYGISFRCKTIESEREYDSEGSVPSENKYNSDWSDISDFELGCDPKESNQPKDEYNHEETVQRNDSEDITPDQISVEKNNQNEFVNSEEPSDSRFQRNKFTISSRRADLIYTGKFVKRGCGIGFAPEFEKELFEHYPEKSIEDSLIDAGINPRVVGNQLINLLRKRFDKRINIGLDRRNPINKEIVIPENEQQFLKTNPYVQSVNDTELVLSDRFYHAAAILRDMDIDDILDMFFINHELLRHDDKLAVADKLRETSVTAGAWKSDSKTVLELLILCKREMALTKVVEAGFDNIASCYKALSRFQKKNVCLWIESLPKDPSHIFTKHDIMRRIGISRSIYYRYTKDKDFGTSEIKRKSRDKDDAESIRYVFEYKGFKKGYRQIYMLLPRLTGKRIGLQRVRKIMKTSGLESGVRSPNPNRQGAHKHDDKAVKPNLLRRKFRTHRPNEVRVTDVTCLKYGHDERGEPLRAYGSALMDPVTSRLFAFVISENNNLELALKTLHALDEYPCIDGGIFHSDQGVLYKANDFQDEVLRRNLRQSMSKKGNCWDNATQESFFGHFKDECDCSICETIESLRNRVAEFVDYYNNERGLWDRNHMTPVEYEDYLLSMSDEDFECYLAEEEEKYIWMKIRAAELAKKRYGTLGV